MTQEQYQQEIVLPKKMSDLDAIVEDFGMRVSPDLLDTWKGSEIVHGKSAILDMAEQTPAVKFLKNLGIGYRYISGNPYFDYHNDGMRHYPNAVDPLMSGIELEIIDKNVIFTKDELFKRMGLNLKKFWHRFKFGDSFFTPKEYIFREEVKNPDAGLFFSQGPIKISKVIIKELDPNHYKIERVLTKINC